MLIFFKKKRGAVCSVHKNNKMMKQAFILLKNIGTITTTEKGERKKEKVRWLIVR